MAKLRAVLRHTIHLHTTVETDIPLGEGLLQAEKALLKQPAVFTLEHSGQQIIVEPGYYEVVDISVEEKD